MESKKSTAKYWLFFTLWTILIVYLLATPSCRPFFWLALPGVCTSFVKGMDII